MFMKKKTARVRIILYNVKLPEKHNIYILAESRFNDKFNGEKFFFTLQITGS